VSKWVTPFLLLDRGSPTRWILPVAGSLDPDPQGTEKKRLSPSLELFREAALSEIVDKTESNEGARGQTFTS
jgi:hypothetical protein